MQTERVPFYFVILLPPTHTTYSDKLISFNWSPITYDSYGRTTYYRGKTISYYEYDFNSIESIGGISFTYGKEEILSVRDDLWQFINRFCYHEIYCLIFLFLSTEILTRTRLIQKGLAGITSYILCHKVKMILMYAFMTIGDTARTFECQSSYGVHF